MATAPKSTNQERPQHAEEESHGPINKKHRYVDRGSNRQLGCIHEALLQRLARKRGFVRDVVD